MLFIFLVSFKGADCNIRVVSVLSHLLKTVSGIFRDNMNPENVKVAKVAAYLSGFSNIAASMDWMLLHRKWKNKDYEEAGLPLSTEQSKKMKEAAAAAALAAAAAEEEAAKPKK